MICFTDIIIGINMVTFIKHLPNTLIAHHNSNPPSDVDSVNIFPILDEETEDHMVLKLEIYNTLNVAAHLLLFSSASPVY